MVLACVLRGLTALCWVQVRVLPSQGKNRLYIGNLPRQLTKDAVVAMMKPLTKGVHPAPGPKPQDVASLMRGMSLTVSFSARSIGD